MRSGSTSSLCCSSNYAIAFTQYTCIICRRNAKVRRRTGKISLLILSMIASCRCHRNAVFHNHNLFLVVIAHDCQWLSMIAMVAISCFPLGPKTAHCNVKSFPCHASWTTAFFLTVQSIKSRLLCHRTMSTILIIEFMFAYFYRSDFSECSWTCEHVRVSVYLFRGRKFWSSSDFIRILLIGNYFSSKRTHQESDASDVNSANFDPHTPLASSIFDSNFCMHTFMVAMLLFWRGHPTHKLYEFF